MNSVYNLKPKFQSALRPLCVRLANKGVTANQVTLAALGLSFTYGLILCLNIKLFWLFLPFILLIRMGLNAIDGMLAREHNMKSKLGIALNELGDVLSDTALLIPFMFYAPNASWSVALLIFAGAMTEMCGLCAYMMSGVRRYDGPMGKSDRASVTGAIGFLIGMGSFSPALIPWVFVLISSFCMWSCVNRIKGALRHDDKETLS